MQAAPRTLWRFFPLAVFFAFLIVFAVNGYMTYMAIGTFPGLSTHQGFANSNGYDRVLNAAERQAALGWTVRSDLDGMRPVLTLADRTGAPLAARVTAVAQRPLGDPERTELVMHEMSPGQWQAEQALAPGKWDLEIAVASGADAFHTIRRLVAK